MQCTEHWMRVQSSLQQLRTQLRIQYAASRTGQQPSVYKRNGRALSGTRYDDVREVELDDKKINEGLFVELY